MRSGLSRVFKMAWPSVTHISFVLSIIYLKGISGQQNGLLNQANANSPIGSSLPSNSMLQKNLNSMSRCPLHQKILNGQMGGNLLPPMNMQQLNLQQAALQQQFNLQQAQNLQQSPNFQPTGNFPQANLPQFNVPPNLNQFNSNQMGNLQQLNLQQPGIQQLQQPTPNINLGLQNNLQPNLSPNFASLQMANPHIVDNSIASVPPMNPLFSGIPSQIPQQFPDAGMMYPISPSMPYSLNFETGSPSVPIYNQPISYTSNPSSVIDLSQITNSGASFTPVSDFGNTNNQQYALVALPVQNQRTVNTALSNIPSPTQGLPNQVTIIKSTQPQSYFDPTQTSMDVDQKLSLISSLMSDVSPNQLQSNSLFNGNSILGAALSKSGSKSSNLQTLLPLLFNLLKEKNSGCACHHCGCINNKQEPQTSSGYANKNNSSHEAASGPLKNNEETNKDENIDHTQIPKTRTPEVKKKSRIENTINSTDSGEYDSDDYFDNYDDEEQI